MKIISNKPELLDELFAEFKKRHLSVEKETKQVENAQGDITLYLSVAQLALQTISTFLDVLTYFNEKYTYLNNNHYIHIKFSDGRVVKLENISKEERRVKLNTLREKFNEIDFIEIG